MTDEITLCCLLWAHPGKERDLTAYEDRVLDLLADHGATVVERVIRDQPVYTTDQGSAASRTAGRPVDPAARTDDHPVEVQVYRFPDQGTLERYLSDPHRVALAAERDRVIRRTELFPVRPRPRADVLSRPNRRPFPAFTG
ncbi:hypothetical protein [Glaciibacter flavus]|uniref:hypothetical protein n=1 Tax=Orlajensenia flava TaxID=2565934 RepID=UPI003B0010AD